MVNRSVFALAGTSTDGLPKTGVLDRNKKTACALLNVPRRSPKKPELHSGVSSQLVVDEAMHWGWTKIASRRCWARPDTHRHHQINPGHARHEALWEEEVQQRKALGRAVRQPVAHDLDAESEVFDPRCQRLE